LNLDIYNAGEYLAEPKPQRGSRGRLPASHAEVCLHVGVIFIGVLLDSHFASGERAGYRTIEYDHLSDSILQRIERRGLLFLIGGRYGWMFEPDDAVCRRFQFDGPVFALDGDVQLRTAVLMGVLRLFVGLRDLGGRRAEPGCQQNAADR
jgi:hypothetical protein